MKYYSVLEVSKMAGMTKRRVQQLCKEGKIDGAVMKGNAWAIPDISLKNTNMSVSQEERKHLPLGVSDYIRAQSSYYVDKTLLIKDIIDSGAVVSLFTRPRRFGKTLNMDMLKVFFEKSDEDTSVYFKDKKIWKYGDKYTKHQGKYPVIYLTFKDLRRGSWSNFLEDFSCLISDEFTRHKEILNGSVFEETDVDLFKKIKSKTLNDGELVFSLKLLTRMLSKYYGINPIIIIDEYDIPIQQGYFDGFYNEIVKFMRIFFSATFKDNKFLSFGFLTGILRVAKESIFSGLNNLMVNSIMENEYGEYFGFTKDEVVEMLKYYGREDKIDEVCEWYDGYKFGDTEIFNPWSVVNYITRGFKPNYYWISTSDNSIISELLAGIRSEEYKNLLKLLTGENVVAPVDTSIIYPEISNNPASIYSFLLVTGYLKFNGLLSQFGLGPICYLAIPNKEIKGVFEKEIMNRMDNIIFPDTALQIEMALATNDSLKLKKEIQKFLMESISYNDGEKESFYHGLLLGMFVTLNDKYYIKSNREEGLGRYDISLEPKKRGLPGIIIEVKWKKEISEEELKVLASKAREQIESKKYYQNMESKGISEILKFGVAFSGKNVEIIS